MLPIKDENPTYHRAWITIALIVVNLAVFTFIQQRSGVEVIQAERGPAQIDASTRFIFEYAAIPCELTDARPLDEAEIRATLAGNDTACEDRADSAPLFTQKSVWLAALTSMFLHGGWFHLGFNMLFLWVFGNNIEDRLGPIRYLLFYLVAGVAALATHVALQVESTVPVVGASGAIAGVMGAYLIWFPRAPVRTLIFFFLILFRDIPAMWLLSAWFVLQFFTGADSGVAWGAHVGGFVVGVAFGAVVRFVPGMARLVWRAPYKRLTRGTWDPTGGIGRGPYGGGGAPRFGGRRW